jgi:hypothetical protein
VYTHEHFSTPFVPLSLLLSTRKWIGIPVFTWSYLSLDIKVSWQTECMKVLFLCLLMFVFNFLFSFQYVRIVIITVISTPAELLVTSRR